MIKYSLTDFLPIVKKNLEPQEYTQGQFNLLNEVLYIRPKLVNNQSFLMSCQNGIISCYSYDGFEYIIPKNVRNNFIQNFQDHQYILDDSFFELQIGPLNTFIFNDVFLNFSDGIEYKMEPSRKRFTKLLKLFRETKSCSEYSFNLPQIVSSVNYCNQKLETFDVFHLLEPINKIVIL